MNSRSLGVLALIWFIAIAAGSAQAVPRQVTPHTILPGHSLGYVWLGAPRASVLKLWGRPNRIERTGSYEMAVWPAGRNGEDYKGAVLFKGRVIQLETNSALFETPHGISVHSTLGEIRKIFSTMRVISFGADDPDPNVAEHAANYYWAAGRGLTFELDLGYRADTSAEQVPHALFVHSRRRRFSTLTAG